MPQRLEQSITDACGTLDALDAGNGAHRRIQPLQSCAASWAYLGVKLFTTQVLVIQLFGFFGNLFLQIERRFGVDDFNTRCFDIDNDNSRQIAYLFREALIECFNRRTSGYSFLAVLTIKFWAKFLEYAAIVFGKLCQPDSHLTGSENRNKFAQQPVSNPGGDLVNITCITFSSSLWRS